MPANGFSRFGFFFLWKCAQFCAKSISLYLLPFLRHPHPTSSDFLCCPSRAKIPSYSHIDNRQLLMPFVIRLQSFSFNFFRFSPSILHDDNKRGKMKRRREEEQLAEKFSFTIFIVIRRRCWRGREGKCVLKRRNKKEAKMKKLNHKNDKKRVASNKTTGKR